MAGGRPTKYNEGMIDKIQEYLETQVDEVTEFHKTRGEKSDSFDRIINVKLPTVEGFARFVEVDKTTIYEWKGKYPKFSHALERIPEAQRKKLMEKGTSGEYSPLMAKFLLSANHNMREKSDTDVTSKGEALQIAFDPSFKK